MNTIMSNIWQKKKNTGIRDDFHDLQRFRARHQNKS